ncbi:hypothetical protein AYO38_02375 [bacterium SCGC AG-212-C10]|nr:hypothetical protein AYO38_02375 [bacterium SCGC AG-212-C10]
MTARVSDSSYHFTIRIPGLLLAAAFVLLAGWFLATRDWSFDSGVQGLQPSAEIYQESTEGQFWTASLRIEGHEPLERPLEGWVITFGGGRSVPVAAVALPGPGGADGRAMNIQLYARLPEGTDASGLQHAGVQVRRPEGGMEVEER